MNRAFVGGVLLACVAAGTAWLALRRQPGSAAAPPLPVAAEPELAAPAPPAPVVEAAQAPEVRRAVERPEKPGATPTDAPLAAAAAPAPPTRAWADPGEPKIWLHVRDRASGRELSPVLVVAHEGRSAERSHPGRSGEQADDLGSSPVPVLAPQVGQVRTLHARSPDHAWGRIELGEGPDERFLDLDPGGDLRVLVAGGPRDSGTRVRVLGEGPVPLFETELGERDELAITGLPAGPAEVVALLGNYLDPREIGGASVEIVAGTTVSTKLVLEPVEPARWVPLGGSLVVPPEWDTEFTLTFELDGVELDGWDGMASVPRSEMTLADRESGLYRWTARDVQPGRYAVELLELGFGTTLDVGPSGARDVRIAVPPPCLVRLRCTDAVTGESAGAAHLYWRSTVGGADGSSTRVAGWKPELGCFEFRAPCGAIRINSLAGSGHEARTMDFQVGPGLTELEFVLRPQTALRPVLMDGAQEVPWDVRHLPALEPLDEQEDPTGMRLRQRRLTMTVADPGRYLLRVPPLDGYEPVPDQIVELERGVSKELVIPLVRRP